MNPQIDVLIQKKLALLQEVKDIDKQIDQETYNEIVKCVERDGICFVADDFAYKHKLKGVQASYYVPIENGKLQRDKAFIKINKTKYNVPQPHYLEYYSDVDILNEIWGSQKLTQYVIYDDIAILPQHLLTTS